MTARKKPRAAKVTPAPAAALTAGQLRAAQLFATMDDKAQESMLRMMAAMARDFPRHVRPTLRLVGGGAK